MATVKATRAKRARRTINLALQGGGAHGAFSWGVLDRLLEEDNLWFEGISATSAGAINAVVLAHGLTIGGRQSAKDALHTLWQRTSQTAAFSPIQATPADYVFGNAHYPVFAFTFFDMLSRLSSPYQLNPFNINPLRTLLDELVDFTRLQHDCTLKMFISATNVRSGKIRIFHADEVTTDAVMASACLPFLFQAVEIDGESYWDGGYMGNPAIYPLIYECDCRDVLIVHVNPLERDEVPKDAMSIMNRVNEISFNSSLMREMRAIAFVTDLIDKGEITSRRMKRMLMHAIEADDVMRNLGAASKMNVDWGFLQHLRDVGRAATEVWLENNYASIGNKSSIDIRQIYL